MTVAALLLAAGASRRFGPADKLRADLRGAPLVTYAAQNLTESGADLLIAVLRDPGLAALLPPGFATVQAGAGQSDSLRAGLAEARRLGAGKLLVALGDMPFVPGALHRAVVAACSGDRSACAAGPSGPMPPACFPQSCFDQLAELRGDRGAGALLTQARQVPAQPGWLIDIDSCDDLREQNC